MTMKRTRIAYWVFTALFGLSMLSGAALSFFDYTHAREEFSGLGFPVFIIYPLALAKISGVIGILQRASDRLREWAYAGFFFNLLLAFGAHLTAGDGEAFGPALVMAFMIGSYFFGNKMREGGESHGA